MSVFKTQDRFSAVGAGRATGGLMAFALCTLLAMPAAFAAGPPEASYPERHKAPHSSAERDEKCADRAESVARYQNLMKRRGSLSRVNFLRVRYRKSQRFLREYCGDTDYRGLEVSHAEAATGEKPPVNHPAVTDYDHPVHWYAGHHGDDHGDDHGSGHGSDHGSDYGSDHGSDYGKKSGHEDDHH